MYPISLMLTFKSPDLVKLQISTKAKAFAKVKNSNKAFWETNTKPRKKWRKFQNQYQKKRSKLHRRRKLSLKMRWSRGFRRLSPRFRSRVKPKLRFCVRKQLKRLKEFQLCLKSKPLRLMQTSMSSGQPPPRNSQ